MKCLNFISLYRVFVCVFVCARVCVCMEIKYLMSKQWFFGCTQENRGKLIFASARVELLSPLQSVAKHPWTSLGPGSHPSSPPSASPAWSSSFARPPIAHVGCERQSTFDLFIPPLTSKWTEWVHILLLPSAQIPVSQIFNNHYVPQRMHMRAHFNELPWGVGGLSLWN